MIYLVPEIASGLGEDTFWTWAAREWPNSVIASPSTVTKDDVILQYSTKGASGFPANTMGLLWEIHPEMRAMLHSNVWDSTISAIVNCGLGSARLLVSSPIMRSYYGHYNKVIDCLPLGL